MNIGGGREAQRVRRAAGFSVHLFTGSGAAVALLALYAAIDHNFPACFAWLGLALLIDGVDGTLARVANVTETASAIDGATLDLVIDFLTYVLVPMVALWRSDLMPIELSFWLSVIVVFASALYFADTRMKTTEQAFRGFPAVWNAVVYQLMVYKFPEAVTLLIIAAFAILTFVPVEFIHPMRVKRLRPITFGMTIAWGLLAFAALIENLNPDPVVLILFSIVNLYFAIIGVFLQVTRTEATAG